MAWEFGSSAWEVRVPLAKIVFFSGLLPKSCLAGESEHLVLGGYYNVRGMIGIGGRYTARMNAHSAAQRRQSLFRAR